MNPRGAFSTPRHSTTDAVPARISCEPRNSAEPLEPQAASTLMMGMPGRATWSKTFWPLAISAPTLATRTRSTSRGETSASASARDAATAPSLR